VIEEEEVSISSGHVIIKGSLNVPQDAKGLVLFAHGSGSSRFSPRNRFVANYLQQEGIGTLLIDLLTESEEVTDIQTRQYRFDILRLTARLLDATDWAKSQSQLANLNFGYFGSSTGAAAALMAAAEKGNEASAVVSRGGRPDLAGQALTKVHSPTLLIIGGDDTVVIDLNQQAFNVMSCEKRMEIVPGATHLFEEPGTLEEVANWFVRHF
jgi:putative phosphoribosyl transferase